MRPINNKSSPAVPKLRFPEFQNAEGWKEERLGDLGSTFNGLSGKTKVDFGKGKQYIQYMQIFSSSKIDIKKFGLVNIKNNEKQNQVQYGDIFFTTSSETQNETGISSVLIEQVDNVYLNSFCFGYRPNSLNELIPKFSQFFFRSDKVRMEIIKLAQGVTRFNMSKIKFMDLVFNIPEKQEQQKIADCLSPLDALITTQTQKLQALQQHKKGLMQNLFPAEGKTTPKLRFPEFVKEGEWEVKVFEKVFDRLTSKNEENNQNVLTTSAQFGLVRQLDYFNKKIAAKDVSGYYLLHKGDFVYNKSYSKGYPMGAIKPLKLYDKGVVSTLYICFRANDGYNESFFEQYFDAGLLNNEIGKIAQEGGRAHGLLNVSIKEFFKDVYLLVPTPKEQQKIADCLSSLDALITTQTQKLQALQQHKKGLMQQLFPATDEVDI